jgi:hypothetical protein
MFGRFRHRLALLLALVSTFALAVTALPAVSAQNGGTVRCAGTADFCGATVSIAGGASNRVVTINYLSTEFRRVAVRVIGDQSRGAFRITHASFLLGGSEYRFTLNAARSNPRRARIVLLFAAGQNA